MELIVTFTIIKYCSHDIVQIYSLNCEKTGDKVVKSILLDPFDFFFQEHFRSLTWRGKKKGIKNNFHP